MIAALTVAGCDGDDGRNGRDGVDGVDGTNGTPGQDGSAGSSCTTSQNAAGDTVISCTDGTSVTIDASGNVVPPPPVGLDHQAQQLVLSVDVQAAYNGTTMFWRTRFKGNEGKYQDYYHFTGGRWTLEGRSRRDTAASLRNPTDPRQGDIDPAVANTHESRIALMFHDPANPKVQHFEKYGCFMTCHDRLRQMPRWTSSDGDRTKYIRFDDSANWWDKPVEASITVAGTPVLDLWHWRAHRGHLIGAADDQTVTAVREADNATSATAGAGRKSDAGTAVVSTQNRVDGGAGTCVGSGTQLCTEFVLDPLTTGGKFVFKWEDFFRTPSFYMTTEADAQTGPLAPNPTRLAWAQAVAGGYTPSEGDTVPRRILRAGSGSAADIKDTGTTFTRLSQYDDYGLWDVRMSRALTTANADDVDFTDGNTYHVGISSHLWEYGGRDHYASLPYSVELTGADPSGSVADIKAVLFVGTTPDWATVPTFRAYLVQPGIMSWDFLVGNLTAATYNDPLTGDPVDNTHEGADEMRAATHTCADCHTVTEAQDRATPSTGGSLEKTMPQRKGIFSLTPLPPL